MDPNLLQNVSIIFVFKYIHFRCLDLLNNNTLYQMLCPENGYFIRNIKYTQCLGIPQFCILENHTKYALKGKNRVDS